MRFNLELADQVDKELREELPTNQWSEGYLQDIIELCCKGEAYFYGHHGAFDRYLKKQGLEQGICENCHCHYILTTDLNDGFCSEICYDEYHGAF